MNCIQWIDDLKINHKLLDAKKQQTDYKIKYVVEYIQLWMWVGINRREVTDLNFIDCMCNAGIYQDGDLCTSMEVLKLFIDVAQKYPHKHFNIFMNDINKSKIDSSRKISEKLLDNKNLLNLTINFKNLDVNDYLMEYSTFDKKFGFYSSNVLFVDPYDFGTVKINRLTDFIAKYYCEILFNLFISDYVRNGIDLRIRDCIGDVNIDNKDELISYIINNLKVGKMKYVFSYQFRTSTNTELYQIIFVTPHKAGLEKLKDALWSTFNGKFYHRNSEDNSEQLCFISQDDERKNLLNIHARDAKTLLLGKFNGETVSYQEMELYLIEYTMMKTSYILKNVIKPLIEEGKAIKCNTSKSKIDFKNDKYTINEGIKS